MERTVAEKIRGIMEERFGHDTLLSLATVENGVPSVRTVDALYEDGSFYSITHARSNKMRQIESNPTVAVCGEWFTAHGTAESLGHVRLEKNAVMADKLRNAFAAWYSDGDVDENDPGTIILRIHLHDAVLVKMGERYEVDFTTL